jgi:hypothetical protein
MLTALILAGSACAQSGAPIKIGYSMSLTGGLAPNGKSALLAQRIWEEDTNAQGGMLGRPVKLIYYDDKSSPSEIPSIYTKLLDIDKVDFIIGAYGTALTAPAMPIVIQRRKTFVGLLGLAVNSQFKSELFRDDPIWAGREARLHERLFRCGRAPRAKAADFGHCGGRSGVFTQRRGWCAREYETERIEARL